MKDGTKYGIGAERQSLDWDLLPWQSIENSIRKLRRRIFRATQEQRRNEVRSLMKLMLRSYLNLLVSVRKVTQKNKGKNTAGVDGELAQTAKARLALVRRMSKYNLWQAKPARRVYIPKTGKPGQECPLGIPTMRNRVAQAIVKNALEPSWEARFELRIITSLEDALEVVLAPPSIEREMLGSPEVLWFTSKPELVISGPYR